MLPETPHILGARPEKQHLDATLLQATRTLSLHAIAAKARAGVAGTPLHISHPCDTNRARHIGGRNVRRDPLPGLSPTLACARSGGELAYAMRSPGGRTGAWGHRPSTPAAGPSVAPACSAPPLKPPPNESNAPGNQCHHAESYRDSLPSRAEAMARSGRGGCTMATPGQHVNCKRLVVSRSCQCSKRNRRTSLGQRSDSIQAHQPKVRSTRRRRNHSPANMRPARRYAMTPL